MFIFCSVLKDYPQQTKKGTVATLIKNIGLEVLKLTGYSPWRINICSQLCHVYQIHVLEVILSKYKIENFCIC